MNPAMETQAHARQSSWGSRTEKLLFALAVVCILIWGLAGDWELPPPQLPERVPVIAAGASDSEGGPSVSSELASRGAELFQANGCYACHSVTGERKIGPTLLAIYGEPVDLSDGSSAVIDDAYLLESILSPQARLVAGFEQAAMPNYDGLVSESDAEALAEYIKSLN